MSELDNRIRAVEREFCRRSEERLRELQNLIYIDTRPQIASASMRRGNDSAWKIVKSLAGCVLFVGMIWAIFLWFGF